MSSIPLDEDCFIVDSLEFDDEGGERTGLVCLSGGKDSVAMLLRMLELDDEESYPITKICFADTRFEYPELYEYLDRIQKYLDVNYPDRGLKIDWLQSDSTWEDWFYGEVTRGANKGKIRGAPLVSHPCWWSREAKVLPLQKVAKEINATYQFIGIAADETKRISKDPKTIRYPLVEWGWTEADCIAYLDEKGLGNPLYLSFKRLGCFHCPKKKVSDFYQDWLNYPELFQKAKFWSDEGERANGMKYLKIHTLSELEEMFENGYIPKSNQTHYDCRTCNAVSFFSDGSVKEEDFDSDDAIERDAKYSGSKIELEENKKMEKETEWIPPSQRGKKGLRWL